ncbi:hypothetical protein [Streptomyces sp. NPDC090026]|uniref:hypothetical protein n=1 Tax=Streptomyces sp. NPDC090026 TaxID=3365923 RepID=UPI003821DF4D
MISVQPLSGTPAQAQDMADRTVHARWTLRADGTLTTDTSNLPALHTTALSGTTRLLSGEQTRTTDVSTTTTWVEAQLLTPDGRPLLLHLTQAATGVTHAVVACQKFDTTVTSAALVVLELAEP